MGYQLTHEPLTPTDVAFNMRQNDGRLIAVIAVELWDIINGNGIEDFNNILEEKLLVSGILMDIDFEVVGSGLGNEVHVRVNAEVEFI